MELTERDIQLLLSVFEDVSDKLRHFPDGEMDWDPADVADFYDLARRHREAAKAAGFRWAQH